MLNNHKSVVNRTVKISLIWLFIQTDFPEYSQYKLLDNQTVSHSQSIFNKKNDFDFLALVQFRIE